MELTQLDIRNDSNASNVTRQDVIILIEAFKNLKSKETELFMDYQMIAFIFGSIIFISNLTVVISSGLIIKKGQQPKSTYLLLGNVSLADTIVGLSIIFGTIVDNPSSQNPMCIFQLGMLVCPTMVSIFSVGLIAIDRYIYILHGLYYQRWCNMTRVKTGIVITWILGITLGFAPASGWINTEMLQSRCYYVTLFPGTLILLNSILSIIPIALVTVLYTIILIRALRNLSEIKKSTKSVSCKTNTMATLRINRGNVKKNQVIYPTKLKRSASLDGSGVRSHYLINRQDDLRSQSFDDVMDSKLTAAKSHSSVDKISSKYESRLSIHTITSTVQDRTDNCRNKSLKHVMSKLKEPAKWRAVAIVMLTSGCFICTWMPFFITAIFFVFCQEKLTNKDCIHLQELLGGPIATLAFLNSILNPLIYAWWHKGFKGITQTYIRKCVNKFFKKI